MNDDIILAMGREFLELTLSREQLLHQNRALAARVQELEAKLKELTPKDAPA